MLHAVSYALADSVNLLLIAVVLACAVILPQQGKYWRTVGLLIAGDWFGVFFLSVLTMLVFDGLQSHVQAFLESPWAAILLILVGLLAAIGTWRGGDNSALIQRLLGPLRAPSAQTVFAGFVLGFVQSITSLPFFFGLAHLSTGEFSSFVRYAGLVVYASLALSLPALVAVLAGVVRAFPESVFGRLFDAARRNGDLMAKLAGYGVSVFLVAMGIGSL